MPTVAAPTEIVCPNPYGTYPSSVGAKKSSDGQERPGRRPRFLRESLATGHEYGSPASPGAATHSSTVTQATLPAVNAGGEGVSRSAPPDYQSL